MLAINLGLNSIITHDFQPGQELADIIETIEKKRNNKVFIKELPLYQKIVEPTVIKQGRRIYFKEDWSILMESQVNNYKRYKELTVVSGNNMITANLNNNIVVYKDILTLKLYDNDICNCKAVDDLLVCENIGSVF